MLKAILKELDWQKNYLYGLPVDTIYFGGGTPSLLTPDELKAILDQIGSHYNIANLKEVTLEANPDDITPAFLKAIKHTAINRFSMGVQSFFDEDLRYMGRAHNALQADFAIKAAQDAGFENITIDFIYGVPGLSDEKWVRNLDKIRDYRLPHFSAYALTVEEGTALYHAIRKEKTMPVNPDQAAGQFEIMLQWIGNNGYEHYEISNIALPGRYAVHNTNYWRGIHYLGIGPSAHSYNGLTRQHNKANNTLYIQDILQNNTLDFTTERLTPAQKANEYIMTSLRTMWGCDLGKLSAGGTKADTEVKKNSQHFIKKGWLILKHNTLFLTDQGKLFADHIAAALFLDEF